MKIPRAGTDSSFIALTQPWQAEPGFQDGQVHLAWESHSFQLRVEMTDAQVVSSASADSQWLYLLGDTLEVFLLEPGAPAYFELHISPDNFHNALRWPLGAIEGVRQENGTRLEDFQIAPDCFASRVTLSPRGWDVEIDIPPQLLGRAAWTHGQELLISVSRYDYAESNGTPILSTTSAHRVKNFHLIEDWRKFTLV